MKDWILCIIVRIIAGLVRFVPLKALLYLAQGFGRLYYYFAGKKNRRALAHLRLAFPQRPTSELKSIVRQVYMRFAQNYFEVLYLPYLGEEYFKKHIRVPQLDKLKEALHGQQGGIFLACHAGSWELSNIACAMFLKGTSYAMLTQPQKRYKRLDDYLNRLRESKGCRVIRVDELKKVVAHLTANNVLGVVADHGGKDGVLIDFFAKPARTPVGGIKLARKLDSRIFLAYMRRVNGLDHEMLFEPYALVTTGDEERDIEVNLTNINKVFEKWIRQYPEEYLWFYKRWKYSTQKNILVLSDGKAGHLKQSLAVSSMVRELGFRARCEVVPVHFKNRVWGRACALAGLLIGPARASWFFSYALEPETRRKIDSGVYDIVISAGSSVACVNLAVARSNDAKSIAVMKPGMLPLGLFDLVLMPEHDHPPVRRNVLKILGSLNSVDAVSMKADFDKLLGVRPELAGLEDARLVKIGLLIGGDSKNYKFTPETTVFLCEQIKKIADEKDGFIFVTTSRRTPPFVIDVINAHFGAEPRCKLLVVATVDNPEGAVGAIFHLSDIVVVSGESISMVSEAVASGKYAIVFEPRRVFEKNKIRAFLNSLGAGKFIFLVKPNEVYPMIAEIIEKKPLHATLNTRSQVLEGLKNIL